MKSKKEIRFFQKLNCFDLGPRVYYTILKLCLMIRVKLLLRSQKTLLYFLKRCSSVCLLSRDLLIEQTNVNFVTTLFI